MHSSILTSRMALMRISLKSPEHSISMHSKAVKWFIFHPIEKRLASLLIVIFTLIIAPEAFASSFIVNCQQIDKLGHTQVHIGLSVMGRRVSETERNYLHSKYHSLSNACLSNPRARTQLRASPQLISLLAEYGFLR